MNNIHPIFADLFRTYVPEEEIEETDIIKIMGKAAANASDYNEFTKNILDSIHALERWEEWCEAEDLYLMRDGK